MSICRILVSGICGIRKYYVSLFMSLFMAIFYLKNNLNWEMFLMLGKIFRIKMKKVEKTSSTT